MKQFYFIALAVGFLLNTGCIEREFHIGSDVVVMGDLNPSFATILGDASWNVSDALSQVDSIHVTTDLASGGAMLVQPFDLFQSPPIELPIINEVTDLAWEVDAATAAALTSIPAGQSLETSFSSQWDWTFSDMDTVDSLWISQGSMQVSMTTDLPLDIHLIATCNNIFVEGNPLTLEWNLTANGSGGTWVESVSTEGAVASFQNAPGVVLEWDWQVELTSTGLPVQSGQGISLELAWMNGVVSAAFGKFSSAAGFDFDVFQELPQLAEWTTEQIFVADPRIVFELENTSGIPIGLYSEGINFWNANETWTLLGEDVESFPVIAPATSLDEGQLTEHVIDNSGTTPSLSQCLQLRPDSLALSGHIIINPNASAGQFITLESELTGKGRLEIPLFGWVDGLTWVDTILSPISQELSAGIQPPLDWQDLDQVILRFRVANGWPLGASVTVNFLGSEMEPIEDLATFEQGQLAFTFEPGFLFDENNPNAANFGRVQSAHEQIIDVVLSREQGEELMNLNCEGFLLTIALNTAEVSAGQNVRFYADDLLQIGISAKVDCSLDLNE